MATTRKTAASRKSAQSTKTEEQQSVKLVHPDSEDAPIEVRPDQVPVYRSVGWRTPDDQDDTSVLDGDGDLATTSDKTDADQGMTGETA